MHQTAGRVERAEWAREKARRDASLDGRRQARAVTVAEATLDVASRNRQLSSDAERLARASFVAGGATSLDVIVAAAALRQAELSLAVQEFEVVRARVSAALALARCHW
jgi:outer membrane protein TolC